MTFSTYGRNYRLEVGATEQVLGSVNPCFTNFNLWLLSMAAEVSAHQPAEHLKWDFTNRYRRLSLPLSATALSMSLTWSFWYGVSYKVTISKYVQNQIVKLVVAASDKHSEAATIYEGLIKRNPENHAYYRGQAYMLKITIMRSKIFSSKKDQRWLVKWSKIMIF